MKEANDREVILSILKGIEAATPVGSHRRDMWDRCWSENDKPPYFSTDIVRYHDRFYHAPGFEQDHFELMRVGVYEKYLEGVGSVSEFGSGPGANLKPLIGKKRLFGYDWSRSAVKSVKAMGMEGEVFDMFAPHDVIVGEGVLTIHAMEQLGARWEAFFKFLLQAKPKVVIHIEPIEELYDPDNLMDHLALQYHRKRGYLSGYLSRLKMMGSVQIIEARRNYFGSLFHEAYSLLVWRPR